MLDALIPISESVDLTIPSSLHKRIGIVGAGAIVELAHLPAYRKAGLPVVGITDIDAARAEAIRAQFGLARTYELEGMLSDPTIEVIDVAVVPEAQPDIVRRALRAGKHVLAQKPLAPTSELGASLVADARDMHRCLVVNHQMRYGEGIAVMSAVARSGWLGELTAVTFEVNINTDWSGWGWLLNSPQLDLMYHSIHYLDTVRSLLGNPTRIFCATGRRPGQRAAGETRTMTTMLFASGARAQVNVNHENFSGDLEARLRLDGSEGSVRATIGLLYNYPHGRPDTVEISSRIIPTDGWLAYPVTTRWIPDAFAGPMRALLSEIAEGTPAPTTASDALQTLRLVEACYRSAATGEAQEIA